MKIEKGKKYLMDVFYVDIEQNKVVEIKIKKFSPSGKYVQYTALDGIIVHWAEVKSIENDILEAL